MQATHYRSDEEDGVRRANRQYSSLGSDNTFAEMVLGEKQPLVVEAGMTTEKVWHNVLRQTRNKTWLCFIWSVEILLLLFVLMTMAIELWGACPYEEGLAPVCKYCFSGTFLIWNSILLALWLLDLYLFVLLVSRGFTLELRKITDVFQDNEVRGIPSNAISTFLYLTTILLAWVVVGIFVLILSASCNSKGPIFSMSSPGRSGLLVSTTSLCVVLAPFLLFMGRRCGPGKNLWLPENFTLANLSMPEINIGADL